MHTYTSFSITLLNCTILIHSDTHCTACKKIEMNNVLLFICSFMLFCSSRRNIKFVVIDYSYSATELLHNLLRKSKISALCRDRKSIIDISMLRVNLCSNLSKCFDGTKINNVCIVKNKEMYSSFVVIVDLS